MTDTPTVSLSSNSQKDTARTPGPWEVFEGGNFVRVGSVGYIEQAKRTGYIGGPLFVAEANYHATEGQKSDHQKAVAIGHLIAAAPELLEALKAACCWVSEITEADDKRALDMRETEHRRDLLLPKLRAAIAKAQGGTL